MSRSARARAHTRSLGQKPSACNAGPSACAANPPVIGAIEQAERLAAEMTGEERGPGPARPVLVLVPLALYGHYPAMRVLASAAEIQPDAIPPPVPPNLLTEAERRVLRHPPAARPPYHPLTLPGEDPGDRARELA